MTTAINDFQEFHVDTLKEMVISNMQAQMNELANLAPHPEYEGQLQTLTQQDSRAAKGDASDSLIGQFIVEAMGVSLLGAGASIAGAMAQGAVEAYDDMQKRTASYEDEKGGKKKKGKNSPKSAMTSFSTSSAPKVVVRKPAAPTPPANAKTFGKTVSAKPKTKTKAEQWRDYRNDMDKRVRIERYLQDMSQKLDTLDRFKMRGIEKVSVTADGRLAQNASGVTRMFEPTKNNADPAMRFAA